MRHGAILSGSVVDEHGGAIVGAELAVVSEEEGGSTWAETPSTAAPGARAGGWDRLDPGGELGVLRAPIPYPPLHPAPVAPVPAGTTSP